MLHPFSRRHFLKGTALALGAFALNGFYGTAHAVPGNVLVAYFSWSGNTRGIARLLHQKIGGELVSGVSQLVGHHPHAYSVVFGTV